MFHHFHSGQHPKGQGSISGGEFENILHFIGIDRVLDPHEWMERLQKGMLRAHDLCLTFDDALLSQFDIALPILTKYNLKAFWFVYSNPFDGAPSKFEVYRALRCRYFRDIDKFYNAFFRLVFDSEYGEKARTIIEGTDITAKQRAYPIYSVADIHFRLIRDHVLPAYAYENIMDGMIKAAETSIEELSTGLWMTNEHLKYLHDRSHHIGLHSYSHPMALSELSLQDQQEEYQRNYAHIKQICGIPPLAMAHPANSYNETTLAILMQLGIQCGFRANMSPPREGEPLNRTPLEIAREDHANIIRMMK